MIIAVNFGYDDPHAEDSHHLSAEYARSIADDVANSLKANRLIAESSY